MAKVSIAQFYRNLKSPNFIQAVRVRGLAEVVLMSNSIVKRVCKDAVKGRFMQQKMALTMAGHVTETPLVQQVIANINKTGISEEELDQRIAQHMTDNKVLDITKDTTPVDVSTNDK